MVKHTQTIRRLLPWNCLSVFDHFVGLALEVLKQDEYWYPSFDWNLISSESVVSKKKTEKANMWLIKLWMNISVA